MASKTAVGHTATISVRIGDSWHYYLFPDWQQVNLHEVLVNWDETSAMYDNFGGSSGISGKYSSTILSSRTIYQSDLGNYISWTVPISIIQGWIDNPSSNFRLMFVPPGYNQCEYEFNSKESGFPPILSFEVVPEPVSLTLFGINKQLFF